MVRLIEKVPDGLVLEHSLVHPARDYEPMRFKSGDCGFHEGDCAVAKLCRHDAAIPPWALWRKTRGQLTG